MSQPSRAVARGYGLALARAFADSAGPASNGLDVPALAAFFDERFAREAARLPPEGRDEFLSAVGLEMLDRMGQGAADRSPAALEASFKRAVRTVLDTVRHRMARARTRDRLREEGLDDAETPHPATRGPELEGLLRRELIRRLSPDEMAVLYLVTEGQPLDEIARRMNVSRRTIYRALAAIRASLEESRREDAR